MQTLSLRVPDDLADEFDDYCQERSISKSEAGRQLLRAGLRDEDLQSRLEHLEQRVERLEADRVDHREAPDWWPFW